jgi:hypothetical protein
MERGILRMAGGEEQGLGKWEVAVLEDREVLGRAGEKILNAAGEQRALED